MDVASRNRRRKSRKIASGRHPRTRPANGTAIFDSLLREACHQCADGLLFRYDAADDEGRRASVWSRPAVAVGNGLLTRAPRRSATRATFTSGSPAVSSTTSFQRRRLGPPSLFGSVLVRSGRRCVASSQKSVSSSPSSPSFFLLLFSPSSASLRAHRRLLVRPQPSVICLFLSRLPSSCRRCSSSQTSRRGEEEELSR